MNQPHPKQIYEKYHNGDKLTDNEVIYGTVYFKRLAEQLNICGPVFKLAADEAQRIRHRLYEMSVARRLECPSDPAVENIIVLAPSKSTQNVVSWANTMNPDHLTFRTDRSSFNKQAALAGYPYFAWNSWVYYTNTGIRTNILAEDL